MQNDENLVRSRTPMHYFGGTEVPTNIFARTHPIASIRPKLMFGCVLENFATQMHAKRRETGALRYSNALFRGTHVPTNVFARTHSIAYIRPKMMFGCVLEYFATPMHTKRRETGALRYSNALFRGTHVPTNVFARTHSIASIRPKMMFGCVLEHFGTPMHTKR